MPLREQSLPASEQVRDLEIDPEDVNNRKVFKYKSGGLLSPQNPSRNVHVLQQIKHSKQSSIDLTEAVERNDVSLALRTLILFSFLASSFYINVEQGIVPPAILVIQEDLQISKKQIAILQGVTLFVCGILSIFTAPIFLRFEARSIMVLMALTMSIGLFIFSTFREYEMLVLGRVLAGISQAMLCTYGPVWIDEFSPK